jgi:hypothetical protein
VTGVLSAWLPAFMVVVLTVLALLATTAPWGERTRGLIATVGALTLAAAVWQASAAGRKIARLIARDRSAELVAQVKSLQDEVAKLRQSTSIRSLGGDTAARLADYLRPFGRHRVIVSCVPNDIEAYHYATQIADALKAANWDARGPEATTIFGDVKAMGINVYDDANHPSETVKILVDALAKFGIPYQTRVPPGETIAPNDAVELYVGAKPAPPAASATAPLH